MLQAETSLGEGLCPTTNGKGSVVGFLGFFLQQFLSARDSAPSATQAQKKHVKPAGFGCYTLAQIAEHSTSDDCWLVVEGKVYDVSGWGHPGGDVIYSYAGRDATEAFNVLHKDQPRARAFMKVHLIGEVNEPNQSALLKDWNEMRIGFLQQGLMDASPLYYVRKIVELAVMATASLYLNWAFPNSVPMVLLSAVLFACCMFQCGWTQHDFQHNQVFRSHKLNATVGNLVIGLGIGGSAHWWKNKHNQHHATPNKVDDNGKPVDPDIDTIPLLAWSEDLMKQVNTTDRGFILMQHLLLWPLLFVALVNWQAQGIIHLLQSPNVPTSSRWIEMGLVMTHHFSVLALAFVPLGFKMGLMFWAVAHALAGFGISFVFVQSHNAMEIYSEDKDFVTSQMVSTRNINPGVIADWVMGGLNYQIEHHLFPTMPRHSFSRVRQPVMEFCARHGLPYESCSIWESTYKVYRQLAVVAKAA
eukprot:CAMPEP_0119106878 /NCGR_PEP_ID=MMETSP1180-20130426/6757_1 /TAXON_ID=3052 ORGANISM="Chlamydomonas cf sp, Strain CCMP681" /NCGR_SAMPLE_ID=MMETSP1180 /ASSEMBLY_ACC=CAM_ASM_000741 /LENGTH=471 /DNA_ID=CAMNT_0007092277 /DNA_START=33 /DNA_END=1448 /DNA_ORIENTATION=+